MGLLTAAAVTSAIVAAGSLGYSVYSGEKAKDAAEEQAKKQEEKQNRLIAEAKEKERVDALEVERDTKRAKQRQSQFAAQSSSVSKSFLTNPIGLSGNTGQKTLLGQ